MFASLVLLIRVVLSILDVAFSVWGMLIIFQLGGFAMDAMGSLHCKGRRLMRTSCLLQLSPEDAYLSCES